MKDNIFNIDFWKNLLTGLLMALLIIPPLLLIIRKSSRVWVKQGIEGDNNRLDLTELWELLYMFLALCSFWLLAYMIINKTIYGVVFTWEEYLIVFSGTLGSNTASVVITWIKNKKPTNEK